MYASQATRQPSAPAIHPEQARAISPAQRAVDSAELLLGQKTVEIRHNGAVYRLQATRQGKLILTK